MLPKVWSTSQQRTALSKDEIAEILDNLTHPAMLIQDKDQQIAAINLQAAKLCDYQRADLIGMDFKVIFPSVIGRHKSLQTIRELPGQSLETVLVTRKSARIPVSLRLHSLDGQAAHYLAAFIPIAESQRQQTKKAYHTNQLHNIERLINVVVKPHPINQILEIGSQLLIANTIALYTCEQDTPVTRKTAYWGEASVLPNEIPPTDLQHLISPSLWLNGQRSIVTILHHAARVAKYAYLAAAPIGNPGACAGFIVAAGQQKPDMQNTLPVVKILAQAISTSLQHNLSKDNLNANIHKATEQLNIMDTLYDAIQEGVLLISPKATIVEINAAAEYMLGYSSQEIHEQPIENILVGTDRLSPAIKLALQGVPTHNLGKTLLHRRDGSSFPALIHITPVIQSDQVLNVLIILQDVSEHEQTKTLTQQLEQRALLGEVTAVFAHEVRNPINNISTGLQLMALNTSAEDHKSQDLIDRLQQDCTRLTTLMESILTFSRTGNYKFVPLDVKIIIERLLMRWRPRLARLKIQHHLQTAPNTPIVLGDQRALEQVFTNLISNAVQAMGEAGGTLAIRIKSHTAPSGKLLAQIDISDTGPGIPDDIRKRIFDPFFTTDPNGTGLGLAITKQIITAHKGVIVPTSFPGGTVFQIQIPALEANETDEETIS